MAPPSVLIAANPYEGELCRKALKDTGLRVVLADDIATAMSAIAEQLPLVVVIADGWQEADARELLVEVRSAFNQLPIFLIEDKGSDILDEEAARRRGASRLFLRPIDLEAVADAIEKLAVEAEMAQEVSAQLESVSERPEAPAVGPSGAAGEAERSETVEIDAPPGDEWGDEPKLSLGRIELKRAPRGPTVVEATEPPSRLLAADPRVSEAATPPVEPPPAPRPEVPTRLPDQDTPIATPFFTSLPDPEAPPSDAEAPSREAEGWGAAAFFTPPSPSVPPAPSEPPPSGALPRISTEVMAPPPPSPSLMPPLPAPPASTLLPHGAGSHSAPLLRADDALADAAGLRMSALAENADFVARVGEPDAPSAVAPPPRFVDRSTFARRLDRELSEVEKRLFPDSTAAVGRRYEDYDDALGDIDLDALGLDTLPGIAADVLDGASETSRVTPPPRPAPPENGRVYPHDTRTDAGTTPLMQLQSERGAERVIDQAVAAPLVEEGSLEQTDISELLCSLYASGWTGRLALTRGEQERHLYFDAGMPVFATSSFVHDRLGDMLYREGKLTREQHKKTRELVVEPGRRTAALLVELGMLKPSELYPTLRRHVEEILYSCFAWESGRFQLGPEQVAGEDRLRLSAHPWALYLEGIRRKYGLERLVGLAGSPETVLQPTTNLERALGDAQLTGPERVAAEQLDGERSLADVELALSGLPGISLSEPGLYALAWALIAMGAVRVGAHTAERLGIRAASTVVTPASGPRERRAGGRENGEGAADRAIDRERLLAKRAQVADSDYFAILGVDRRASPYEIERAYERLRVDFAPEQFADAVRAELAETLDEIHLVLAEARRVLMDEGVRSAYREHLLE